MNFVYQTQGIEFEWDINKAESNFFKHGVRFEEAVSCCAFSLYNSSGQDARTTKFK